MTLKKSLQKPHSLNHTVHTPEDFEAAHTRTLSLAIKDLIKKEIIAKP